VKGAAQGDVIESATKGAAAALLDGAARACQRLLGKRQYAPVDDFPFEVLTVAELVQRLEARGLLTPGADALDQRG